MVHNLVYNLCESLVTNIGGVAGIGKKTPPTPITYLTQWKIVGNSEVHTLPYPDGVVLPNGYKRCKYLTFDGASYLNIGKVFDTTSICNTKFATETKNTILIGGRKPSKYNFGIGLFGGNGDDKTLLAHYTSGNYITTGKLWDGNPHTISVSHGLAMIDNVSTVVITGSDIEVEKLDMYIGTWSNNGSADSRFFVGDIYDTIISDGTNETWHGIPCLDANDVPCFYDIVSQTAFYNDGTGTFGYELYPQPTEIWSCGEYNPTDGKWHILVQPLGGSIADIALDEPLRKVNDVADTIEFPSDTEGKALVTRHFNQVNAIGLTWTYSAYSESYLNFNNKILGVTDILYVPNLIVTGFDTVSYNDIKASDFHATTRTSNNETYIFLHSNTFTNKTEFENYIQDKIIIYQLATPTTELVDAPQIEEAESYSMVISQGGKAVEWSSFETN